MKLLVITLGKPREVFITAGGAHYMSRLKALLPLEVLHLPDSKSKGANIEGRRDEEGKEILKRVTPRDKLFLLDEGGSQLDSPGLSQWLYDQLGRTSGKLILQIGGPWGFSPSVRQRADGALSLSKLTFPHEMAWLILMEQTLQSRHDPPGFGVPSWLLALQYTQVKF